MKVPNLCVIVIPHTNPTLVRGTIHHTYLILFPPNAQYTFIDIARAPLVVLINQLSYSIKLHFDIA